MFRFTRKPSSGSHRQYLAKTTHLVQCGYTELVQDVVSVMAAYYDM
jgi:predicted nucleic-acid-binding Zn-ribbon protein